MSFLAAGAGLLARGVSALFSGDTREARQARREERRSGRQASRAERAARKEVEDQAAARAAQGTRPGRGDVPAGGADTPGRGTGKTDYMALAKQYWWAIALVVLFFTPFGKKLMKPPRRAPRRRPKPKVVTRYRTRKAPVKRRR